MSFYIVLTVAGTLLTTDPPRPEFIDRAACQQFGQYMERALSKGWLVRSDQIDWRCLPTGTGSQTGH